MNKAESEYMSIGSLNYRSFAIYENQRKPRLWRKTKHSREMGIFMSSILTVVKTLGNDLVHIVLDLQKN